MENDKNKSCATGECKHCNQIRLGDHIDPFSRAHIERNACNRCPTTPPEPNFETIRVQSYGGTPGYEFERITHYEDKLGNKWKPDNAGTAWIFHDDPFPGFREQNNMTFRVIPKASVRGWQCRYENGVLDDETLAMGTYDYAEAGTTTHYNMDVVPHGANPNYTPNLTKTYGAKPSNYDEMQEKFRQRRASQDKAALAEREQLRDVKENNERIRQEVMDGITRGSREYADPDNMT